MVSYLILIKVFAFMGTGLNPYCSGRWSRTDTKNIRENQRLVLILIVVEDGLVLDLIRLY